MDGHRFCNGFSIEDATDASFAECTLLAAGGCLQRLIHDVYTASFTQLQRVQNNIHYIGDDQYLRTSETRQIPVAQQPRVLAELC